MTSTAALRFRPRVYAAAKRNSPSVIPILVDENYRSGKIKKGDTVLMCALGAGISWGSALVRM